MADNIIRVSYKDSKTIFKSSSVSDILILVVKFFYFSSISFLIFGENLQIQNFLSAFLF